MAKNWIADAIKRPGALRAKAKARGMISGDETLSGADIAELARSRDKRTRAQARLAAVLKRMKR